MELKVMKSERMKELADRASHCVCKYCGSPLEVRLVVFGKMEEAYLYQLLRFKKLRVVQ